jgi:hypothetical protein
MTHEKQIPQLEIQQIENNESLHMTMEKESELQKERLLEALAETFASIPSAHEKRERRQLKLSPLTLGTTIPNPEVVIRILSEFSLSLTTDETKNATIYVDVSHFDDLSVETAKSLLESKTKGYTVAYEHGVESLQNHKRQYTYLRISWLPKKEET